MNKPLAVLPVLVAVASLVLSASDVGAQTAKPSSTPTATPAIATAKPCASPSPGTTTTASPSPCPSLPSQALIQASFAQMQGSTLTMASPNARSTPAMQGLPSLSSGTAAVCDAATCGTLSLAATATITNAGPPLTLCVPFTVRLTFSAGPGPTPANLQVAGAWTFDPTVVSIVPATATILIAGSGGPSNGVGAANFQFIPRKSGSAGISFTEADSFGSGPVGSKTSVYHQAAQGGNYSWTCQAP